MKLSETQLQLLFTMSTTTPLLHWGLLFLLKKISSLPPSCTGVTFLVEEKFLGFNSIREFKSTHEFKNMYNLKICTKVTSEPHS